MEILRLMAILLLIILAIAIGSKALYEDTQSVTLNLSRSGTVTFARKGKTVFVVARVTCPANEAYIINSNYSIIPEWAIPMNEILYVNTAGVKILEGNTTTVKEGTGKICLAINENEAIVSTVIDNTNSTERVFTMNLVYLID